MQLDTIAAWQLRTGMRCPDAAEWRSTGSESGTQVRCRGQYRVMELALLFCKYLM